VIVSVKASGSGPSSWYSNVATPVRGSKAYEGKRMASNRTRKLLSSGRRAILVPLDEEGTTCVWQT